MVTTYVRLQAMKAKKYLRNMKKDRGGKEILVELGLAVVAIALLLLFKNSISAAITTITGELQEAISNLFGAP